MLQVCARNQSRVLAATVSAIALAASCPAMAQAQNEPAKDEAVDSQGIQDIVVTARKFEEAAQTVPLAITAVGAQELETRGVTQVADIQKLVPSISTQSDQYTNFGIKIGIRGQFSSDTLLQSQNAIGVYMDGVYVANSAGLLLSNIADVKQIEVLKGPQGTLFGRNTTGGALVVTTNLPEFDALTSDFKIGAGSHGRLEFSNTTNIPLSTNAALRLTGQYSNFDGFGKQRVGTVGSPLSSGRKIADQETYSFRGVLAVDPVDTVHIVLRGDYSRGESAGRLQRLRFINTNVRSFTIPGLGPVNVPSNTVLAVLTQQGFYNPQVLNLTPLGVATFGTVQNAANATSNSLIGVQTSNRYRMVGNTYVPGHIREYGGSGTVTFDIGDTMELKSITSYRHMNYFTGADSDATVFPLLDSPNQIQKLNVFSQELTLNGSVADDRLKWTLGGYYFHQKGEDIQRFQPLAAINPLETTTNGLFTQKSAAVFGQASYSLTDTLRVTAGLRYTDEKQVLNNKSRVRNVGTGVGTCDSGGTFPACTKILPAQKADNISYTFSVDYRINPDVMIYARTSRGFKGGGTNERGGALVGQTFLPEEVTDYELGFKSYLLDRRVRFNLAAYRSDYKDIQRVVIVPSGTSVTSIINNAASATIDGVEVDLLLEPVDGLAISFAGAYTDPKYEEYISATGADLSGNSFQAVAKYAFNAAISYEIPVGENVLKPSLDYVYQSKVNFASESNTTSAILQTAQFTTQKGYGLLNGRIAFEFDDGDTTVAIWGKNLTDKFYLVNALDVAQSLGLIVNDSGAPRTYGIELIKRF